MLRRRSFDLPPDFFQSYLNSICQHYAQWCRVYTLTDVVGQASSQGSPTVPMWDLGLKVQTIDRDKDPKTSESKTKRFTVLEGFRKYAADHVLLVGQPGSGKSTALVRLLIEEAQKAQQDSSALIPVLVELRYYQDSVLELMRSFFKTHNLLLDLSTIETLLFERRFLLLIDGLNELPSEEARSQLSALRRDDRKVPMISTTRDLGVGGNLNLTRKLEMQPLTEKQMQEFVQSYLPTRDTLLRQLGDRLRELGQTPLLLLMLCSVFANNQTRVPPDLGSVFREFTQIHYCKLKEDAPVAEGSREYWAEMLQVLAWKMTQRKSATELQVEIEMVRSLELSQMVEIHLLGVGRSENQ
ncbi:NACHT domain-containing protein [Phormidesmis priestleyi ULC007]|uniref:NACHT domain-containing protein n=1 Tax=Phormidesmis priestleyi ULC007 TaxID=1920490 RepID=A0A2T1DI62_9CYAN|nr:NACHT domain-containing protein [Phormidesmis priestleyi ULC007]PZO49097.1 MAG: NACHT domain-containing protein [Phormidesmis priestleyi]